VSTRDDFPRRPAGDRAEGSEQGEGDLRPSDELVADAGMRERALELTAQLEQARADEAPYEERYGMTFDEFRASFDPARGDAVAEDYLAWSRAAERVRMLRHELERLADRRTRRPRKAAKDKPKRVS
jgi:hypothetical protein